MERTIIIDDKEVKFKASANVPRLYRARFGRDIFIDIEKLGTKVSGNDEGESTLDIRSLEMFENIAWCMAYLADKKNIPTSIEDWLDQFETFSIYQVLPELLELWGLNTLTTVQEKKELARLSAG